MNHKARYQIARQTKQVCLIMKISPDHVLRRAGMPVDFFSDEGKGVSGEQYFAIWNAIVDEAKRPDLPLVLGKAYARGPFNPAIFAFSCSPNIEIGFCRLALFKPLIGPITLKAGRQETAFEISITASDERLRIPDSLAVLELVFFVECCRSFTAEPIVPLAIGMPGHQDSFSELRAFFELEPHYAETPRITLSLEDAARPLISENAELWSEFETDLRRQLAHVTGDTRMSARVKDALLELLPAGESSVEAVCERLHVSKRSLQRYLRNEGRTFQSMLDKTRSELSLHYLSKGELGIEEISYLLAFRDPNSFYRAFHGWTGMTPMEARGQQFH